MKTITTEVYSLNEISKEAQAVAIEKHSSINVDYEGWYEFIEEDYKTKLEGLGYSCIKFYFSGFYSQGDGACFTADIDIAKYIKSNKLGIEYKKLLNYAKANESMIVIDHVNNYYHANTMSFRDYILNIETNNEQLNEQATQLYDIITNEAINLANELYRALRTEYEYQTSEDQVADTIIANDYQFTKDGNTVIHI